MEIVVVQSPQLRLDDADLGGHATIDAKTEGRLISVIKDLKLGSSKQLEDNRRLYIAK